MRVVAFCKTTKTAPCFEHCAQMLAMLGVVCADYGHALRQVIGILLLKRVRLVLRSISNIQWAHLVCEADERRLQLCEGVVHGVLVLIGVVSAVVAIRVRRSLPSLISVVVILTTVASCIIRHAGQRQGRQKR